MRVWSTCVSEFYADMNRTRFDTDVEAFSMSQSDYVGETQAEMREQKGTRRRRKRLTLSRNLSEGQLSSEGSAGVEEFTYPYSSSGDAQEENPVDDWYDVDRDSNRSKRSRDAAGKDEGGNRF